MLSFFPFHAVILCFTLLLFFNTLDTMGIKTIIDHAVSKYRTLNKTFKIMIIRFGSEIFFPCGFYYLLTFL